MYQALAIAVYCLLFSFTHNEVLVKETFSYPDGPVPGHFWSEGCPAVIRHGRLFIDADIAGHRTASVWLDKELKGDLSIEFDVYLTSSSDDANNINVFLCIVIRQESRSGKALSNGRTGFTGNTTN